MLPQAHKQTANDSGQGLTFMGKLSISNTV